jgi:hypothetical protein
MNERSAPLCKKKIKKKIKIDSLKKSLILFFIKTKISKIYYKY